VLKSTLKRLYKWLYKLSKAYQQNRPTLPLCNCRSYVSAVN